MIKLLKKAENTTAMLKLRAKLGLDKIKDKLVDNSGNWLDESFKYILAVVVGLLFLSGIYALIKDTVLPTLVNKVKEAFSFKG